MDTLKKKILIVDDDKTTAKIIQLYLEHLGFAVLDAVESASEAIGRIKQERPDLVLMDIRLGKGGLDGIDVSKIIIDQLGIPVVYVSAYSDDETLERAQLSHPAGFINKPLREADLKTTLYLALGQDVELKEVSKQESHLSVTKTLQEMYHLTRAEARVMITLLKNPSVAKAADSLHISISTIRTHLKHIYRKTDTNNQSALLHRIVTGPAAAIVNCYFSAS